MTEINEIAMFCLFYSGIVLSALWMTLAQRPLPVEVRERRSARRRF